MRKSGFVVISLALALAAGAMLAQSSQPAAAGSSAPGSINQIVDRMSQREKTMVAAMRGYHPMVESYFQLVRPDYELGSVPVSDRYYLGRLAFDEGYHERLYTDTLVKTGWKGAVHDSLSPARQVSKFFTIDFLTTGFSGMIFPDARGFDRENYTFHYLRREFLGDVRCLVFGVVPKRKNESGRFLGRIWVEDKDYNIVRFNGTYTHPDFLDAYFHMDSWRNNVKPGVWLPVEVYMEESSLKAGALKRTVRFKGQTRLWGYDLKRAGLEEEFTDVTVDQDTQVKDDAATGEDWSPVTSLRMWQREAENNTLDRLEQAGLLAPPGPVDAILTTVANNLLASNDIEIEPEIRCRVLLTSPLESLVIGHTLVISRGLLDVVPDEATLAMVVAHELGHIAGGQAMLDTKYAFGDRMLAPDERSYAAFDFQSTPEQEHDADVVALKLLKNSPYKDKLPNVGLFLRQLDLRAASLPNLNRGRLGNGFTAEGKVTRMAELMNSAPELKVRQLDQVAALPLGGRIKIHPWNGQVELMKTHTTQLISPSEKMPFEVAPIIMRLSRQEKELPTGPAVALVGGQ
jgi:hypothetical protein